MAISNTDNSASIGGTEYSLPNNANYAAGTPMTTVVYLQPEIDFSAMLAGDQYQISIYAKVNGTQKLAYRAYVTGVQSSTWSIPGFMTRTGWDVTLKLLTGSARTIAWSMNADNSDVNTATISGTATTSIAAAILAATLEGTVTVGRGLRAILRQLLAKRTGITNGTTTVRDMADTKTSHVIVENDPTTPTAWTSVTLTDLD